MTEPRVKLHELKCDTHFFDALTTGEKTFEVRRDDRGFQRGDVLELRRYGRTRYGWHYLASEKDRTGCPKHEAEVHCARITYVLTGGQFGIEPGFVVMGLGPVV